MNFLTISLDYLPTQKLWNIAVTISSDTVSPVISPSASMAILISIDAISDGIFISIASTTRPSASPAFYKRRLVTHICYNGTVLSCNLAEIINLADFIGKNIKSHTRFRTHFNNNTAVCLCLNRLNIFALTQVGFVDKNNSFLFLVACRTSTSSSPKKSAAVYHNDNKVSLFQ